MRILFDLTHPVHVHFHKFLIASLRSQGHDVLVTARDRDLVLPLLDKMNIPHIAISKRRPGQFFAAIELLQRNLRLLKIVRRFAPDLLVASAAGISTGPVGLICRIPSLVFDQVDFAPIQNTLGMPLATFICTGDGFLNDYGPRHIRFRGGARP